MKRSAIKTDRFVGMKREAKLAKLGDPLALLEAHIDFAALAALVDEAAPREVSAQGGRPPVSGRDDGSDSCGESVAPRVG